MSLPRRVIGSAQKRLLSCCQAVDRRVLLPIFSRSRFLSGLYYAVLNPRFRREHWAVLNGRLCHAKDRGWAVEARLRRHCHGLEKGLCIKPRKPVFGTAYIQQTVADYRACLDSDLRQAPVARWATDVLREYFRVVGSTPEIDAARASFEQVALPEPEGAPLLPRPRRADAEVSFEQLQALALQRRSVREFRKRPVPRELVEKALEIGLLSPSACNRQPLRFHIFDDPEMLASVVRIPMGCRSFAEGIPMMILVTGELSCFDNERDRHVVQIDAGLASMSFLLALETLGLSACVINWSLMESKERLLARRLPGWAATECCLLCMAVGYPAEDTVIPRSVKKHASQVAVYNA